MEVIPQFLHFALGESKMVLSVKHSSEIFVIIIEILQNTAKSISASACNTWYLLHLNTVLLQVLQSF